MRMNLQLFGGRGADYGVSGKSSVPGVSFTDADGKEYKWYFKTNGKNHFYSTSIGGTPKPTPNNMSPKQMIEQLKKTTKNVKKISRSEKEKSLKEYKDDRAKTNDFLDREYVSNKHFVKGSRSNRITNRVNKR